MDANGSRSVCLTNPGGGFCPAVTMAQICKFNINICYLGIFKKKRFLPTFLQLISLGTDGLSENVGSVKSDISKSSYGFVTMSDKKRPLLVIGLLTLSRFGWKGPASTEQNSNLVAYLLSYKADYLLKIVCHNTGISGLLCSITSTSDRKRTCTCNVPYYKTHDISINTS